MPEPLSIAVATILATKAAESAGGEVGKGVAELVRRLADVVRRKFSGDEKASRKLVEAEEHPDDPDRRAALSQAIARHAQVDGDFRACLIELLARAQRDPDTSSFVTTVLPGGTVGKVTNIGEIHGSVSF